MRFSDNTADGYDHLDLTPRNTKKGIVQLVGIYALTIAFVFGLGLNVETITGPVFSVIVTLLLCGLAFYTVLVRQGNLDQVMTTEFQNLIFASAASHGSDFTMFLKVDGTIVYANDGLRQMFPEFQLDEGGALDSLLEEGNVASSDREKMFSALVSGKGEKLIFAIKDSQGQEKQYIVSLQPLRRPPGIFVVRGREYIVSRGESKVAKPKDFLGTSLAHVEQTLNSVPFGLYIIGADGELEYANSHLEAALGYQLGEMMEKKLRVEHIVYAPEDNGDAGFNPNEYKGELLLQRANKALVKSQVEQRLLTDERGQVSGICATVVFE